MHDKLRIISEAIGRTIPLVELTEEQFAQWARENASAFQAP